MIVVSFGAGLGNQMFEYAFYESIRRRYPWQEIKADIEYAFPTAHNGIEVFDIFNLKMPPIASFEEIKKLIGNYPLGGLNKNNVLISKLIRKLKLFPKSLLIQKDYTEFESKFFELKKDRSYYCYGPFANYKYFAAIQDRIKECFCFPKIEDDYNKQMSNRIQSSNSVSIHLRRGDYIKEGAVIGDDYYRRAMKLMEEKEDDLSYFVFSDDINYAKMLFAEKDNVTFVEGNAAEKSYIDMQLMSLCKHNINANSTFSFWGAFLNGNEEKMVIVPKEPFVNMKKPFICDEWTIL